VGLSAAGVGAGVLTATVATIFVNLWWSVVAIPFVAAGVAFLGIRRAKACLKWRNQVEELSRRIRAAFGAELHREIDKTVEEVRASYVPYLEFYQAEVDRMGEEAGKLEGFVSELTTVRAGVEASLDG
jgi:hypothetical protein